MNKLNITSISQTKPKLSFIVPAMNEELSIETLYLQIAENVKDLCDRWEIIFIDDGSTDNTWGVITALTQNYGEHVSGYRFPTNRGKADALALGYQKVTGDIIFTMDADLQDDPKEIKRFLAKLDEGFDIVSGWKRKRHDPWHKVLPSRVFNAAISRISGVSLHDHNCGFKAYKREVVKIIPMYGDMHRMVPSLAAFKGYKTAEIEVEHHAREFGESKYGWGRILIGLMDMATVGFLKSFRDCPMHFAGKIAGLLILLSMSLFITAIAMTIIGSSAVTIYMTASFSMFTAIIVATQGLMLEHQVYVRMQGGRVLRTSESMNAHHVEEAYNNDQEKENEALVS